MSLNKARIRQRFTRAASTYDRQAVIQLRVADRLLSLLGQNPGPHPKILLEIGCCTGLLTSRLAQQFKGLTTLYVNDLVPQFKARVAEKIDRDVNLVFLTGDIESLELPSGLDLIISSSTFHWLEDLPALFQRLYEHMAPGGTFAFSMYGRDNLRELRAITGTGLQYYGLDDVEHLVRKYFTLAASDEERITIHFKSPVDMLHHLRETGVNSLDETLWSRSRLNDFIQRYQDRFGDQNQVRLTYHPIYCIARKEAI